MILQIKRFGILLACLFFILPAFLFSQKKSLHLKQGRLFTTEGIEVKFVALNQQGSIFTIQSRKGIFDTFDKNEVLRIEQRSGSEALEWGGYLGAIGLVEGMLLAKLIDPPYFSTLRKRRERDRRIVFGSTLFGALIGFAIGYSRTKYKRIYDDPAFAFSLKKFSLNFSSPDYISSFTLSYHF